MNLPLENSEVVDRTCMSFWFPKVEAAGLPVPKTIMVPMPEEAFRDVFRVFDGEKMTGEAQPFFEQIKAAADSLGYPCFLRTGQTSGKHDWQRTCFLSDPERVARHVIAIVEFSECAQLIGLPCDWWAVREYLPVNHVDVCRNFGNMPVAKEFRVFVEDGAVICWHAYWPLHVLEQGGALAPRQAFKELNECHDVKGLHELASKAGAAVGGAWSVDILDTERGWYITDMAEAAKSFHWEDCSNRERWKRQ